MVRPDDRAGGAVRNKVMMRGLARALFMARVYGRPERLVGAYLNPRLTSMHPILPPLTRRDQSSRSSRRRTFFAISSGGLAPLRNSKPLRDTILPSDKPERPPIPSKSVWFEVWTRMLVMPAPVKRAGKVSAVKFGGTIEPVFTLAVNWVMRSRPLSAVTIKGGPGLTGAVSRIWTVWPGRSCDELVAP